MVSTMVVQLEGPIAPAGFVRDVLAPFAALRASATGRPELEAWRDALDGGHLRLALHRDVWRQLKRLRTEGSRLVLLSDLPVERAQLLLRYTPHGDGGPLFDGWLGPEHGPFDAASTWAALPGGGPAGLVSSRPAWIDAAREAGWATWLRDGPSGTLEGVTAR